MPVWSVEFPVHSPRRGITQGRARPICQKWRHHGAHPKGMTRWRGMRPPVKLLWEAGVLRVPWDPITAMLKGSEVEGEGKKDDEEEERGQTRR